MGSPASGTRSPRGLPTGSGHNPKEGRLTELRLRSSRTTMTSFTARSGSSKPSPTLYVQNLDDKIKKSGASVLSNNPIHTSVDTTLSYPTHESDLKRLLYQLFLVHGKVLDVVVKKGKMRGQAFVVFRSVALTIYLAGEKYFLHVDEFFRFPIKRFPRCDSSNAAARWHRLPRPRSGQSNLFRLKEP